jgi:hypothetical protein
MANQEVTEDTVDPLAFLKAQALLPLQEDRKKFVEWQLQEARPIEIKPISTLPDYIRGSILNYTNRHPPRIKECYSNAANLALQNENIIYHEGIAAGIIPIEHAWNSYRGIHFDITAEIALANRKDNYPFTAYAGISGCNIKFLSKCLAELGTYGEYTLWFYVRKILKRKGTIYSFGTGSRRSIPVGKKQKVLQK